MTISDETVPPGKKWNQMQGVFLSAMRQYRYRGERWFVARLVLVSVDGEHVATVTGDPARTPSKAVGFAHFKLAQDYIHNEPAIPMTIAPLEELDELPEGADGAG